MKKDKNTTRLPDVLRDIIHAIYEGRCEREWAEDMFGKIDAEAIISLCKQEYERGIEAAMSKVDEIVRDLTAAPTHGLPKSKARRIITDAFRELLKEKNK